MKTLNEDLKKWNKERYGNVIVTKARLLGKIKTWEKEEERGL